MTVRSPRSVSCAGWASGRPPRVVASRYTRSTVSEALFEYCLDDWWSNEFEFEDTVPLSEVAFGRLGPGRVFRMPEGEVRDRLSSLSQRDGSRFELIESVNQYVVHRRGRENEEQLLARVYETEPALAKALHG